MVSATWKTVLDGRDLEEVLMALPATVVDELDRKAGGPPTELVVEFEGDFQPHEDAWFDRSKGYGSPYIPASVEFTGVVAVFDRGYGHRDTVDITAGFSPDLFAGVGGKALSDDEFHAQYDGPDRGPSL